MTVAQVSYVANDTSCAGCSHPAAAAEAPQRLRRGTGPRASLVALARACDAVLVEAVDQRAARDAEHLGGARLVAGAALERLEDALLLELGHGRADLARHGVGAGRADRERRRGGG